MQKERELVERARAKVAQTKNRKAAEKRGTPGRSDHKSGAESSNKASGGKMAR